MTSIQQDVSKSASELARDAAQSLMATQKFAALATQGESGVHLSLMAIAVYGDLKRIIFATERQTRKYANLSASNRVTALVDNRSNRAADLSDAIAITIKGRAEELHGDSRSEAKEVFLHKHSSLRDFVESDSCALMVMHAESYQVVSRFQVVHMIEP